MAKKPGKKIAAWKLLTVNMRDLRKKYATQIKQFGRYVVVRPCGENYRVHLEVGVQGFQVGVDYDKKVEAEWYRIMLCVALANMTPA